MAVLLAGVMTLASIAGFVELSFTVNGLPPYPRPGWVTVLQPASAPTADVVQLLVQARTEGSQARAAYNVVVCGPRPYSGDLLIGGNAQFTKILPNPVAPASQAIPRVEHIHDLAFYFGSVVNLGPAELVHVTLPTVIPCPPSSGQAPGTPPGGSAVAVVGVTAAPVQQSWAGPWGWWHGPHASQSWPLTGAFPGVPPSALGEYVAVAGLSGDWNRPAQQYDEVSAADVPVSWSVDSALPSASGPYPLVWQSRFPLSPLVRLTDSPSLALLQDWIAIFAVSLGIAGSMLATLLFEWLRPHRPRDSGAIGSQPHSRPVAAVHQAPRSAVTTIRTSAKWLALMGAVLAIAYARNQRRRNPTAVD